jgi:hypothetical protein
MMGEQEQEYICRFCNKTITKAEKAPGWEVTKFKKAKHRHRRKGWEELAVCLECDDKMKNPIPKKEQE